MANGADVEINEDGGNALLAAIESEANTSHLIVDILLKSGAKVNPTPRTNPVEGHISTPLQAAAAKHNILLVTKLLQHGADVNAKGSPQTALSRAARSGATPIMTMLLDHGSHIQARDGTGKTPLHYSVMANHGSAPAQVLLERGAATDMRDNDNWTPLHHAASCGNNAAVRTLLEMGADSQVRDNLGKTPADYGSGDESVMNTITLLSGARVISTPPPDIPNYGILNTKQSWVRHSSSHHYDQVDHHSGFKSLNSP